MVLEFAEHFPIQYTILILLISLRGGNVIPISQRGKPGLEPRTWAGEFGELNFTGS